MRSESPKWWKNFDRMASPNLCPHSVSLLDLLFFVPFLIKANFLCQKTKTFFVLLFLFLFFSNFHNVRRPPKQTNKKKSEEKKKKNMRRSQNGLTRRRENRRGVVCSLTELETECSWEEGAASVTSFLRSFVRFFSPFSFASFVKGPPAKDKNNISFWITIKRLEFIFLFFFTTRKVVTWERKKDGYWIVEVGAQTKRL